MNNYKPLTNPIPISEQRWPEGTTPLVTTRTMTFNHENFIVECLEGILQQKTTFPVQVLVHDDASTDNTINILKEYESKYPGVLTVFYQKKNTFTSPKKHELRKPFFDLIRGKYIALCEGDDYWIDPHKIQKQVTFLEKNEDFVLAAHKHVRRVDNDLSYDTNTYKEVQFLEDVAAEINFITLSVIFRASILKIKGVADAVTGQYTNFLFVYLAQYGAIRMFNENMGVYRVHSGGIWSGTQLINKMNMSLKGIENMILHIKQPSALVALKSKFIKRCLGYSLQLLKRKDPKFINLFFRSFKYGVQIMHFQFPIYYIRLKFFNKR